MGRIIEHFKENLAFYWGWVAGFLVGVGLMMIILVSFGFGW